MTTVIIFGAGATRAAGSNRSKKSTPPLDRDFFEIASKVNPDLFKSVTTCLKSLLGEYSETLEQSLEMASSYLYLKAIDAEPGSTYQTTFIHLLSLLTEVLSETTNNTNIGPPALLYRLLKSELTRISNPSDLKIITFNYDLLIERTLAELSTKINKVNFNISECYHLDKANLTRITDFEPFRSSPGKSNSVSVLKLHGSMNWQSKHTEEVPAPLTMFNPKRTLHVLDATHISPALGWFNGGRTYYMKPVIVPPVSGKRTMMHSSLVPLWELAASALQQAERILIVGYSCPPLDFEAKVLLSENLRKNQNKRLYVIDPCAVTAAKFIDICGVNHATIYTSIKDWLADAPK